MELRNFLQRFKNIKTLNRIFKALLEVYFRCDSSINKSQDISGITHISIGKILYLLDGAFCTTFFKAVQNAPSKFI